MEWEQTYYLVTITVPVSSTWKTTLKVETTRTYFTVRDGSDVLIDTQMAAPIRSDELMWYVEEHVLTIELPKVKDEWWASLSQLNDNKITDDGKSIIIKEAPNRLVSELSQEERMKYAKAWGETNGLS